MTRRKQGGLGRGERKRKEINFKGTVIQDSKERGEWVEAIFLVRAGEHGIPVSKPWGDSRSYDFVAGRPRFFKAVQVKCTTCVSRTGYGYSCCVTSTGRKRYEPGSFDFLAAYVVYEDVWYIIPEDKVIAFAAIALCTEEGQANFEEYREAWHLLKTACGMDSVDIQACAADAGGLVEAARFVEIVRSESFLTTEGTEEH